MWSDLPGFLREEDDIRSVLKEDEPTAPDRRADSPPEYRSGFSRSDSPAAPAGGSRSRSEPTRTASSTDLLNTERNARYARSRPTTGKRPVDRSKLPAFLRDHPAFRR